MLSKVCSSLGGKEPPFQKLPPVRPEVSNPTFTYTQTYDVVAIHPSVEHFGVDLEPFPSKHGAT